MPNQRAENIKCFSITVDRDVVKKIDEYCKENKITRTDFFRLAATLEINKKGKLKK